MISKHQRKHREANRTRKLYPTTAHEWKIHKSVISAQKQLSSLNEHIMPPTLAAASPLEDTGAVVKKGEPILTIVPQDQTLVVLGKLFVKDRGYVAVGQSSKIKLANQDQLKFGPIDAKIMSISPDAVQSQEGSYYEIELELAEQQFTAGNIEYVLVPGIQVQVFILTGERTVLSYITTPFHNGIGQALQER